MEVIDRITDIWFLTEPALFGAFCTHKLVENKHLAFQRIVRSLALYRRP